MRGQVFTTQLGPLVRNISVTRCHWNHSHRAQPVSSSTEEASPCLRRGYCQTSRVVNQGTSGIGIQRFSITGRDAHRAFTVLGASDRDQTMDCRKFRKDAGDIFQTAVDSVCPRQMIQKAISVSASGKLQVGETEYGLDRNVYLVGFGKAVAGMARAAEDILGKHLVKGIISIPVGSQQVFRDLGKQDFLLTEDSQIEVFEGAANNMPDKQSQSAAMAIKHLAETVGEGDILLVLISGGGSALLPSPVPPVTLEESSRMIHILATHGATIQDMNVIRQNLEVMKGGGLALLARPAKVLALILSDVIEDKLDIISSGPTVPLLSSPRQCLEILQRLQLADKVPPVVMATLQEKASQRKDTQASSPFSYTSINMADSLDHVQNVIIGSNSIATQAAKEKAQSLGYTTLVLTNTLQGEATQAAAMFVRLAKYIALGFGVKPPDQGDVELQLTEVQLCKDGISKAALKGVAMVSDMAYNSGKGVCIICGGETVVNVAGSGKGGRNQEMALAFAIELNKIMPSNKVFQKTHVEFLSAGTDGQDGPTDVAGAVVNKEFVPLAVSLGLNPEEYLKNNDSYNVFKAVLDGNHFVKTGLTGTNVMDIQALLVNLTT